MKTYKLSEIKGFITEEEGIFVLHNANGSTQPCTKNEIEFYGGIEELAELVYEPVEVKVAEPEPEMEEPEMEEESFDYDIEESTEEDSEVVEEATKLSDTVATPSAPGEDSKESPLTKAPAQPAVDLAKPVKSKDGGEGKKGEAAKDHTPTDNIKVEPKKA